MNELNDVLEITLLEIENLQGAINVFESAFRQDTTFCCVNPRDVAGSFATIGKDLEKIHEKTNKALEWAAFTQYHGEGGNV